MNELPNKIIIVRNTKLVSGIHKMTGFRPRKEPEQIWSGLCSTFPIWECIGRNIKSVLMDFRGYNRGDIVVHKHNVHCILFKDEEVIVVIITDNKVKPENIKQREQHYQARGVEVILHGITETTEHVSEPTFFGGSL